MSIKEVLEQAIILIETKGWFQKKPNKLGEVCLVYAISLVEKDLNQFNSVYLHLVKTIKEEGKNRQEYICSLMDWNDAPGRTKEEVIELLRKGVTNL